MLKMPELIKLNDYGGDAKKYFDVLYDFFVKDFLKDGIKYQNKNVACIKEPKFDGKEFTFWHIITEGKIEDERIPEMERCKRIRWPKVIIENASNREIFVWQSVRRRKKRSIQRRIIICYNWEYITVLTARNNYYLFCTAYPLTEYRAGKFKKEYIKFLEDAKTAP